MQASLNGVSQEESNNASWRRSEILRVTRQNATCELGVARLVAWLGVELCALVARSSDRRKLSSPNRCLVMMCQRIAVKWALDWSEVQLAQHLIGFISSGIHESLENLEPKRSRILNSLKGDSKLDEIAGVRCPGRSNITDVWAPCEHNRVCEDGDYRPARAKRRGSRRYRGGRGGPRATRPRLAASGTKGRCQVPQEQDNCQPGVCAGRPGTRASCEAASMRRSCQSRCAPHPSQDLSMISAFRRCGHLDLTSPCEPPECPGSRLPEFLGRKPAADQLVNQTNYRPGIYLVAFGQRAECVSWRFRLASRKHEHPPFFVHYGRDR